MLGSWVWDANGSMGVGKGNMSNPEGSTVATNRLGKKKINQIKLKCQQGSNSSKCALLAASVELSQMH